MRALLVLTALVTLIGAKPVYAAFMDGNTLLMVCTSKGESDLGLCAGYALAVADGIEGRRSFKKMSECIPQSVTARQIKDVVLKYLQDNPGSRNHAGEHLADWAIQLAFCPPTL